MWSVWWWHLALYWIVALAFTVWDVTVSTPQQKHLGRRLTTDWSMVPRDTISVLFNQLVINGMLVWWVGDQCWSPHAHFAWGDAVMQWLVFLCLEEVCFYYSHRLLHSRWLYSRIHAHHHRWTEPIALAAISAHPVEHLLSNVMPVMAGPCLLKPAPMTLYLWVGVATLNTIFAHSGFVVFSAAHDLHHRYRHGNYGVMGVLDRWHGTQLVTYASSKSSAESLI